MLFTTLAQHLIVHYNIYGRLSLSGVNAGVDSAVEFDVLAAQLMRIFLFNVFGTFVGIEQIRQMRRKPIETFINLRTT